jgi:hypothetical protein
LISDETENEVYSNKEILIRRRSKEYGWVDINFSKLRRTLLKKQLNLGFISWKRGSRLH